MPFVAYFSGGASNSNPALSLGGIKSSVAKPRSSTIAWKSGSTPLSGVTLGDAANLSHTEYSVFYTSNGTVYSLTIASTINITGDRASVYADDFDYNPLTQKGWFPNVGYSVGGFMEFTFVEANINYGESSTITATNTPNTLIRDFTTGESDSGITIYRCLYLKNETGSDSFFSLAIYSGLLPHRVYVGLGTSGVNGTEQSIANETTAPIGIDWKGTGEAIFPPDELANNDVYPIWIKLEIPQGNLIEDTAAQFYLEVTCNEWNKDCISDTFAIYSTAQLPVDKTFVNPEITSQLLSAYEPLPLSAVSDHKDLILVTLTGAPDSLPDLELKAASFDYLDKIDEFKSYTVKVIGDNDIQDAVLARPNGLLVITRRVVLNDGSFSDTEIYNGAIFSLNTYRGSKSASMLFYCIEPSVNALPQAVVIGAIVDKQKQTDQVEYIITLSDMLYNTGDIYEYHQTEATINGYYTDEDGNVIAAATYEKTYGKQITEVSYSLTPSQLSYKVKLAENPIDGYKDYYA